ncbi:mannose-1-phosphate guanylyltransferase [Flavobacteriaceae bacterium UJ101]|nr:mannose-1-phosphate guanylyltransferase [Flavobacteriaceae bacterium UJ101]
MLFCAGLGTRLRPITNDIPKALVPVNGKTLLQRNIEYLNSYGIQDFVINIHHFGEKILQHLEENNHFGMNVQISDEREEVLETGGGLKKAAPFLSKEDFIVMNVDILTNMNLQHMIDFHTQRKPIATLAVTNRESSRKLLFNTQKELSGWCNKITHEKVISRPNSSLAELAFSGIHIISPTFINLMDRSDKHSIIDPYLKVAKTHTILGYDHSGDILIDVGKHETLQQATQIFK